MKSVLNIRNYFRKNDAEDYINTGMLLRHALSFGLYLLAIVVFFVVFCFYSFQTPPLTPFWVKTKAWTAFFCEIGSFVA
jgi:hypothetical protein